MKNLLKLILFSILIFNQSIAQPNFPNNPEEAVIISTDIKNFIEAYNALTPESDTIEVLKTQYFDVATSGLKEYIARFDLTPMALKKAMQKNPDVYARIVNFYNKILDLEKAYTKELKVYQSVIPQAIFPPCYLLVADYKGIAQASKYGQLVSVEYKCMDSPDVLKHAMLHELTHFQQVMAMGFDKYVEAYEKDNNMLDLILREGAADFITYYLVRENEDQFEKLKNFKKNEADFWKQFQLDLQNQEKDFWLNVSFDDNNKGNPIQLGYAVGYSIVKSYYLHSNDKSEALAQILSLESPHEFINKSQYAPQ